MKNLNGTVVNEKLDQFFNTLECAANFNVAFGFILKNLGNGNFRYLYAHEKIALQTRSKLESNNDDSTKLKEIVNKTDIFKLCSRQNKNKKQRFCKLMNLTRFAALLRKVPVLWVQEHCFTKTFVEKAHIYLSQASKEHKTIISSQDNFRLFRSLALHLHKN